MVPLHSTEMKIVFAFLVGRALFLMSLYFGNEFFLNNLMHVVKKNKSTKQNIEKKNLGLNRKNYLVHQLRPEI